MVWQLYSGAAVERRQNSSLSALACTSTRRWRSRNAGWKRAATAKHNMRQVHAKNVRIEVGASRFGTKSGRRTGQVFQKCRCSLVQRRLRGLAAAKVPPISRRGEKRVSRGHLLGYLMLISLLIPLAEGVAANDRFAAAPAQAQTTT